MKPLQYKLLKYHMSCNPEYLFGHAEICGLLADSKNPLSSYAKYVEACSKKGISYYNEDCYNDFMKDCGREIEVFLSF